MRAAGTSEAPAACRSAGQDRRPYGTALRGQAQLMSADNRIAAIWRTSRQGDSRLDQHHRTERTEITARYASPRVSCIDTGILMPFRRCN